MLIEDTVDELAFLSDRYKATRNRSDYFGLTIVTSLGCNFDCPYCFEAKHPSIMDSEVQEALLRMLDDKLPIISLLNVEWFGGEPLVGKVPLLALSDAFIERCERSGVTYRAAITTNGSLLDEETCVALRKRRISRVQVSLDGPPDIHDRMRPTADGRGTFQRILANIHHAVNYFEVVVRINVDACNVSAGPELLQILDDEGFAGKLRVYLGQLVGVDDGAAAPSTTYQGRCLTNPQFAEQELAFTRLAASRGFARLSLPAPTGAPCTAVRANELVVGSRGELYKCYESVGNPREVIGNIRSYFETNGRLHKWLHYDPFRDDECCSCIALPVCMGGCAHHAMDVKLYPNRCSSFRETFREQVDGFVDAAESTPKFVQIDALAAVPPG
jgi:uncharacterized protein